MRPLIFRTIRGVLGLSRIDGGTYFISGVPSGGHASPDSGLTVRRGVPADADALAELRLAFRAERKPVTEATDSFARRCADWMRSRLAADSHWTAMVAQRDERIVGNVWVQIVEKIPNPGPESEHHGYVSNFFVLPDERNTGTGATLLRAAIEHCRAHRVDTVFLWPTDRSRPFYARQGFHGPDDVFVLELREGKAPR